MTVNGERGARSPTRNAGWYRGAEGARGFPGHYADLSFMPAVVRAPGQINRVIHAPRSETAPDVAMVATSSSGMSLRR